MSAQEALSKLGEFLSRASNANVVIAADSIGTDDANELIFQRLTLANPVSAQFLSKASGTVSDIRELKLLAHDPGYKPDEDELCYMPLSESEMAEKAVNSFASLEQVELFRESDEVIDNLRFYATVVQNKSKQAIFFRAFSPKNELTRSGFTALAFRGDAYNHVEEKVFLFDDKVDCFAFEGYLFILDITRFRRIFGYFQVLIDKADKTIDQVSLNIPIEGLDEFKNMCKGNPLMLSKLARIARKPYIDHLTMSDILRTIKEFELPIEVRDGKLVFDSNPKKRWLILTLLDDDHLGSSMTNMKYRSNSKVSL